MGQTIGRAPLTPGAQHFTNLPKSNIYELWEAFNDIAEGFGLALDEFLEIVRVCLKDYLEYSEKKLDQIAKAVFTTLDDDANDLVDALEFLASFAVISGMTPQEKIRYIFGIFDFDESGVLSVDEMILCLRTTISGLCKLSAIDSPLETDIEHIAIQAFGDVRSIEGSTITRAKFIDFCSSAPEIVSWLEYYGDMDEFGAEVLRAGDKLCDLLVTHGARVHPRSAFEYAAMDIDTAGTTAEALEDRGLAKDIAAAQPWQTVLPFLEPAGVPMGGVPHSAPDVHLQLEWAYGFNAKCSRQTVTYTGKGHLVYPCGALGVVYNVEAGEQQYMNAHTDLILCLRAHTLPSKQTLVATGEAGKLPKVLVWSAGGPEPGKGPEVLAALKGFHRDGVAHVAWALDGELLLTGGASGYHSVAVYDWRRTSLVFSAQASEQPVLDMVWTGPGTFITAGVNHLHFWSKDGVAYKRQRGLFGKKSQPQPLLCAKAFGSVVLTGCSSGHLAVWEGRNCIRSIKAHSGAITALYVIAARDSEAQKAGAAQGLVSGSTDGKIQLWNGQLELTTGFDLSSLGGISKVVHSLHWDDANHKILVASWSAEVYEMHDVEGYDIHDGPLVQGHYEHRVFGLCVNPTDATEFATVGEDRTVRIWDTVNHRVKALATLDTMAHCVAWSPDGEFLAVGLGYAPGGFGPGARRQRKDGAFVVLGRKDLTVVHEGRDSKQLISTLAFSPDGGTLAVGSHDRSIYLYNAGDWASTGKCRGHKGRVTHIDFSSDSKAMQSTDDLGELLFWEAATGEQRTARAMKDTAWESHSCVYGWPLQAAWGEYVDGCELTGATRTAGGTVLATADNFGRLRCYRFPCAGPQPGYAEYRAHGGPVGACAFVIDDCYLLTAGELDCCVMQWRFTIEGPPLDEPVITEELSGKQRNDLRDLAQFDRKPEVEAAAVDDRTKIFFMEERAADKDFTPVRPWQRTVVAPSRPPPERIDEPTDTLRLAWVHGFRAQDVKNGVRYTATGEVLFFGGAANVVLDVRTMKQTFHLDHRDEVMSIAVHPSRTLVATADQGKVPSVLVWDYEGAPAGGSYPTVATLRGHHRRGVTHLAFSPCGKWLASVGADDQHSLVVFDWANQTVRCRRPTPKEKTMDIAFPATTSDGIVQVGVGFIRFWTVSGHNLTWKSAVLAGHGQWQTFTSVGFVGNRTVVGCQDGSLYLFAGTTLERTVAAHDGPVNVLSSTNEGCASGGHDGLVKVWNTVLECQMATDLATHGAVCPVVRSIQWENEQSKIVVGTLGAEIFELGGGDGVNLREGGGPLVMGHSHTGDEVWALSPHPHYPRYATAGDDATLRVWDARKHTLVAMTALEMPSRCIAYSPKGERIAVGFGAPEKKSAAQYDGKFVILNSADFTVLHEARDAQKYLTEVKWSPSGGLLAFGSFDTRVYVYDTENNYALVAVATQHNAVIRGLDFSANGSYFMSNCSAYELCFFEAATAAYQPSASKLKDQRWHTATTSMSWATQGCWPPQADRTDVTTCDANLVNEHGTVVLATGDNFGRVRLYRYPCDSALAQSKLYRAHGGASPISKVRWVDGDQFLVSVSARERIIMQWAHDADDAGAADGDEAEVMDLDPALREAALGDEAGLALAEVADPMAEALGAAESVAGRPWLSAIVEPSDAPSADLSPPEVSPVLERVFGLQVAVARNSLAYNVLGEVIWPSASVCVVYSKQLHEQRFFRGHAAEVSCVAVSRDGRYVASGERGNRPMVRVWDAQTCAPLAELGPFHRQGVSAIAWAHDGRGVATVGADVEHSLALWGSASGGWDDARKLAYSPGDHRAVYFATFLDPAEWGPGRAVPQAAGSTGPRHPGYALATGGVDHVKFWCAEGRSLVPERGLWGAEAKVQPMLCCCAVGNKLVTGAISGHLYVWRGRRCERVIRAHETLVTALWACPAGVVSGGGDGFVKLYNAKLEHQRSYGVGEAPQPPLMAAVKGVCGGLDRTGTHITKVLVSTASSECYELAKDSGSWTLLAEGHYSPPADGASGELWGLAPHPTKPDVFATSGDDGTVRVWSISQGKLLRKCQLDSPSRCITWSPSGRRLLVGLGGSARGLRMKKDGAFVLLDADTLDVVYEGRDSRHWLHDAKYSPEGDVFVVASQDQKLYLYDAKQNVLRAKCDKHNDAVLAVDFSDDGAFIQSDAADFEHLYYNTADGAYFKLPSQLKNVKWQTWTCKMGWPVQGCWPKPLQGRKLEEAVEAAAAEGHTGMAAISPEPTAVHRSEAGDLVAAGYQDGRVKIYRYPCLNKAAEPVAFRSHTADIQRVRFTCDDKYLLTIGQTDRTILVWRVNKAAGNRD